MRLSNGFGNFATRPKKPTQAPPLPTRVKLNQALTEVSTKPEFRPQLSAKELAILDQANTKIEPIYDSLQVHRYKKVRQALP